MGIKASFQDKYPPNFNLCSEPEIYIGINPNKKIKLAIHELVINELLKR